MIKSDQDFTKATNPGSDILHIHGSSSIPEPYLSPEKDLIPPLYELEDEFLSFH
jgi:hypothetical protein